MMSGVRYGIIYPLLGALGPIYLSVPWGNRTWDFPLVNTAYARQLQRSWSVGTSS